MVQRVVGWVLAATLLLSAAVAAAAPVDIAARYPVARDFFPRADEFGPLEGEPPAAAVRRAGRLLGYVFQTFDVLNIPGYSGRPINNLVGLDTEGRITGVAIVFHEEPVLVIGITDADLKRYIDQYRGKSVFDRVVIGGYGNDASVHVDGISGATITTMVENATILRAARAVADARGLPLRAGQTPAATRIARPATQPRAAGTRAAAPAAQRPPPPDDTPLWVTVWQQRTFRIAVLAVGLAALTLILVFQDWLARHPKLLLYVRDGYLVFTLLFIGWYGLAQLSVINVLTFTHSIMHDFRWSSFLIDPMMFMLWGFVAITLLLWGRGVYCGWLCPYGALQELVNQLGRKLKLRQWEFPEVVHERLWALKYVILLVLFGVSLQSLIAAERLAEVEPFKTAITMRFDREWPFVLYAAGFVVISLVNRKFYCKYLCPLGAALTFPARFRIFDWLRRRKECGSPCQVCANECEVQAINSVGAINANECHYCLDCQVTYYNDHKCPPLVERRKRREKSVRAREKVREMEEHAGPSGIEAIPVRVVPRDAGR
ncbi:MAG TPA: 4Fe-4S binding protein [Acidiferrobacterales bacterium]